MSKYGIPEQDLSKNLSNKINKIDTVSGQNQQDLTIVKRMLGDLSSKNEQIKSNITSVENSIQPIKKDIADNKNNISSIKNDIAGVQNKVSNLKMTANNTSLSSKNFKSKNVKDALDELFINVDNEKNKLYSAIIDKKVTPKSKELKDLTSAIDSIKLGQGTAQPNQVLKNATFTNNSGVVQEGNIPNMGSKELTPQTYKQELSKGYYEGIKVDALDSNILQSNFPNLKPENVVEGVNIGGIIGSASKIKLYETYIFEGDKKTINPPYPKYIYAIDPVSINGLISTNGQPLKNESDFKYYWSPSSRVTISYDKDKNCDIEKMYIYGRGGGTAKIMEVY